MKIVLNNCYGSFGLSQDAIRYCDGKEYPERTDKKLIEFIEKYGSDVASNLFSKPVIVEIPDNSFYEIVDYDGVETVYYSESPIKYICKYED